MTRFVVFELSALLMNPNEIMKIMGYGCAFSHNILVFNKINCKIRFICYVLGDDWNGGGRQGRKKTGAEA